MPKLYKGSTQIKKIYAPQPYSGTLRKLAHVSGTLTPSSDGHSYTGFSSENFLLLNQDIFIGWADYEFKFYVHLRDASTPYQVMIDWYPRNRFSFAFVKQADGWHLHSNWGNGTNWKGSLNGPTVFALNQNYHVMVKKINGVRSIWYRRDGETNWHNEGSTNAADEYLPASNLRIGKTAPWIEPGSTEPAYCFAGYINIDESYLMRQNCFIKKIYKGGQLIWQADPYDPGTTVWYQTGPGTFEAELEAGVYDLIIAGGGGYGYTWVFMNGRFYGRGGSGAAWEGAFYNPVKQHCKIYAGNKGEASYFDLGGVRMITAGQGGNGGGATGSGGAGGVISVNGALQILEQRKSTNGTNGAHGTSGYGVTPSVCSLNNWGQGAASSDSTNIAGGAQFRYIRLDK